MSAPALLLAAALAAAPAATAPARPARIQLANSSSTSYHPVDDHTILIEARPRWYRLTTTPSRLMLAPQSFFVNEIRGTSSLCSPLDFQLSVADYPGGFREPLIVRDFAEVTPAEGKALLKRATR